MIKKLLIITLAISFFACKKDNTTASKDVNEEDKVEENLPVIIFQKSPCYGTCPIYKAEIYKDGRMVFYW